MVEGYKSVSKRWNIAQSYEQGYWKRIADRIASDAGNQLTWYEWKASQFEQKLSIVANKVNKKNCRILEIGSGPIGIVTYLEWGERYALDPLGDFYGAHPELVALRNKNVHYLTGKGEEISFPDKYFSVVIIDNVLDHVSEPFTVLKEIRRVLANDGVLYIELNIHTFWGYLLHTLLAKLKIDKGHPYSFTSSKIRQCLNEYGFGVMKEFINDYYEASKADRESDSVKSKLKGYSGLSEFIYCAVSSKQQIGTSK